MNIVYRWRVTRNGWTWEDMSLREAIQQAKRLAHGHDFPVIITRYRKPTREEKRNALYASSGAKEKQ